ncbi:MAG TPA: hypothetical protein VIH93_05145 [Thermoanaerobaculia bacterium]
MALLSRSTLLAALLCLAGVAGAAAQLGGPPPGPLPLFPPDNWWNLDVSGAPVDPASGALIQFIGPDRRLHPDFGGDDPDTPDGIFGFPYAVVPGSQPLERVTFVLYGDESDAGAPGRPPGYPIPPAARTAPKWIEGGPAGGCDDADCHLLLVDRDHRLLFELYQAHWTGARWEAGSGAIFPLDSNARRPEGWTSADAAGLAILPGLVRYDEAFGPDPIRHAFRFTVRSSNGHVYPASHTAGGDPAAPPLGARLRLKAGKDLSGYPPEIRKIFQAMKTYGLILADNGSDMYVQGTYDTRWNNDVLNPAFASLKASDFEVVKLGVKGPAAGVPCAPTDTRLCLGGTRFAVETEWTTAAGANGPGHAVALTADTGYFWFFDRANVETVVKVLDACAAFGHRWVFATGLTNVLTTITVTDTATGAARRYDNPQSTPFRPIQDTGAFACP